MTSTLARVVLRPRRARPFFARHPWVFEASIERVLGDPKPGDEVVVVSHEKQFVARGLFNPSSSIRVRLFRWEDADLDDDFWSSRVAAAVRLRRDVLGLLRPRAAARLVFSEGDGLSGLTVDRYDDRLVASFSSRAMFERRALLVDLLRGETGLTRILTRVDKSTSKPEGLLGIADSVQGDWPEGPVEVVEHGLTYRVDMQAGQKTGFYLDQRENRRAVAHYCRGRRVLDLFCYAGGFALNASRHGKASEVYGVDGSAGAIEAATENALRNDVTNAKFEVGDVFDALKELRSRGERFGVVICDPPKFAKHAGAVDDALKGYLRLNRMALEVLEPEGVLATCSCSGLVDRGLFLAVLGQAAELSGRTIQLLEQRGQAADHPVSVSCLESDYLKCMIARVSA